MSELVNCCLCDSKIVGGEDDFGQGSCTNELCFLLDIRLDVESWQILYSLQVRLKELETLTIKQREVEAQLQGEINQLELEKAGLELRFQELDRRADMLFIKNHEMEAENAELRSRGAVYFGLQKNSGYLLVDQDSGQLEIYETLQSAQLAKSLGQTIVRIRVCKDDEGEA